MRHDLLLRTDANTRSLPGIAGKSPYGDAPGAGPFAGRLCDARTAR